MSVLIKHMAMPKGCIYANDKDQTEYCPLLNHDDVPFCQYIENEPEIAIGIDERPVYCPLSDVPEPCQDTIYRQDAIDAFGLSEKTRKYGGDHSGYDTRMLYEIQDVLEGLPSAQPERKKGTWINEGRIIRCNKCKIGYATVKGMKSALTYNFCPNCGADMRGEQDEMEI